MWRCISPAGLLRAPRKVHRVVPQFTRAFVLRLARLSNYCFLQGDRCLVYFNLELWAEQDTRVRSVQHGTYLRVVATPPPDSTLTTEVALNFAISVDEDEATTANAGECTAQPRIQRALALHQTHGLLLKDVALSPVIQWPLGCSTGAETWLPAYDLHMPAQRALSFATRNAQPTGWRSLLAHAFNLHGFVECTEEGFVAYITTWFVDHLRSPRCEESRSVRLVGTEIDDWQAQIVEVWHDKILPDTCLDIRMIVPTPPHTETETTLAHLLLEQNRVIATHAAGIISVIRQDRSHAALRHVAVSMSRLISSANILRKVRLQDLCALRRCDVTFNGGLLRQGDLEDLDSGFCVVVHVPLISYTDPLPAALEQLPLWAPAMAAVMDAHARPERNETDDDVSFFQTNLTQQGEQQNLETAPCRDVISACKPGQNDEDPELPMTFPGPDLPRRRRPRHDGREEWIPTLWHLFQTQGVRGTWDNELTMQVTTWFIHHNQRTTCRRPREILLSGNPVTWIDDLRNAWIDHMDPRRPFSIWIVQPRPPQFQVHPSTCHILLEQGSFERHVAVVLTALMEGHSGDGFIQGAFSTPAEVGLNAAVQAMELAFFCANRRCRLFRDGQMLEPTAEVHFNSGNSLCIRMEPPQDSLPPPDPTEQLHFEDLSLMQNRNRPVQQPSASASAQPAQACFLNPFAQVFQPDRPNIWLFPEFIQTLHTEWEQAAFAWESEAASAQVQVWFVDHRFHFPTCRFPRPVTLYADFTDWEQRIKSAWSEYLQAELSLEIAVVTPSPPQLEHGTATHVILVQAPNDAWATSLVSIIDLNIGYQPARVAITTPERVTFEHVVQAVGYEAICTSRQRPTVCALWFELQRLLPGNSILGWNGFGFVLVIEDGVQHQANIDMPADEASLLQMPLRQPKLGCGQRQTEDGHLKVHFADASRALDRLDTHFTLPTFDVEEALKEQAHWLPQCLPWIRSSWYAFDHPLDHISVYYDGSFLQSKGSAGAAAAAFVCLNGQWSFAGAVSAHIEAPEFGSYTAEIRAALLATKLAYDLVKIAVDIFGCQPSVTFVYDSLTVGRQAEGLWQGQKDKVACHAVRSLLRIIQTRWKTTCEHTFVSGHSGDPGNELVDTIALCAAQGCPLQDWSTPLAMLTNQQFVQAISWGWVFQYPAFNQHWSDDVLMFPAKPQTAPTTATVGPRQFVDVGLTDDMAVVKLNLLTCNVLTLAAGPAGADQHHSFGPARLQSLVRQFEQAGITIFALQETRLRTPLRLQNSEYHLWHSPANSRGHYGMLIGFAKQMPIAFTKDGSPHQQGWLDEQAFAVVASDPRFLIIKVHSYFLKCIVVSAHAPHSGADQDNIDAFWNSVDQAIPCKYAEWPKLLLADANCRFGDCPNQYIGDHDAEIATTKSEAFCHFVATHDIFLPASFASCHVGTSGTWKHPNGEWTRNDVIGVSQCWPLLQCQSWIDTHIDVTVQKDDHRPARVTLEWHAAAQSNVTQQKLRKCPAKFCMTALDDVKLKQNINDWICLDVHTHFHNLQTDLAACTRSEHHSPVRHPRKKTMSEETWMLVCTKRKWRSNLASCQQLQRKTFLQTLLFSWRFACLPDGDSCSQKVITAEFDLILKQLDIDVATALHQFRCFGRRVTQALRLDDAQFYASLAQESSQWLGPQHTRQLWQILRRNMPKFRQRRVGYDPLKIEALDDQWMPHFCQLEVGKTATCSQLLEDCHARQLGTPVQQHDFDMSDLPTIEQLEDALRQTPAGKATGFDVLPSQLFRQYPCDLADVFFPLLLKMFLWQHEPIAGKGGQLAVFHKKGSPFAAQNYRGIMLLPTFTKRVHALLRTQIMHLLHRQRPPGQLGGFAHQQVMYGSQSLQLFGRIMDGQNITSGILFLDLTTAFHRLVREWTSGINVDADLEEVLAAMDLEGLPVAEMCSRLHLPCLLERLGAPAFLIQLIKDVHTNTWMTVGTKQAIATTKGGTRPGSPLADCIFHVLMSDILHHLQAWIDAQEAFNEILQEFDVPGSLVAWADDLAIPWATRRADEMPAALRAILSFVMQLFQSYGFLLNLDKGKTSAVVSFRGTGSPQLRQRYQLGPRPGDTMQVDGQTVFLHYVPSYKHLGTIFAANRKMDLEIRSRIGQAHAAFNQLSKPILGNRHLPEQTRVQLFNSLVGTKLFFGLGAWLTPTQRQMAKLKAVLLRMLQRVLRLSKDEILTTTASEVFRRAQQPDPRVKLAVDRLLYAQRLWQHGPADLQHLIHREHALGPVSWMEGLIADLKWMQTLEQEVSFPIDTSDLTSLFDFWQSGSPEWQKRVKRAHRRFQRQEQMMHKMHRMHRQIMKTLQSDATFLGDLPPELDQQAEEHRCFCGRCFTTAQGLAAHKRKQHHMGAMEKHLIDSPTCPSCLKFFWSRQRLYQHLSYIPRRTKINRCFQDLQKRGFRVLEDIVPAPSVQPHGLHRTEALQALGPRMQPKDSRSNDLMVTRHQLAQTEATIHNIARPEDAEAQQATYWQHLTTITGGWFRRFQDSGFDSSIITQLPDEWLDAAATADPAFPEWLESVYIGWGRSVWKKSLHVLRTVRRNSWSIARLLISFMNFRGCKRSQKPPFWGRKSDVWSKSKALCFLTDYPDLARPMPGNAIRRHCTFLPFLHNSQIGWRRYGLSNLMWSLTAPVFPGVLMNALNCLPFWLSICSVVVDELRTSMPNWRNLHMNEDFEYRFCPWTQRFLFSTVTCRRDIRPGSSFQHCTRPVESQRPYAGLPARPFQRPATISRNLCQENSLRTGRALWGAQSDSLAWTASQSVSWSRLSKEPPFSCKALWLQLGLSNLAGYTSANTRGNQKTKPKSASGHHHGLNCSYNCPTFDYTESVNGDGEPMRQSLRAFWRSTALPLRSQCTDDNWPKQWNLNKSPLVEITRQVFSEQQYLKSTHLHFLRRLPGQL